MVAALEAFLDNNLIVPVGIIVVQAVLLIAVSFTISLYIRSAIADDESDPVAAFRY